MSDSSDGVCQPLFLIFVRIVRKLRNVWLRTTLPFAAIGGRVWIGARCEISRGAARFISIGDHVTIAPDTWLNVQFGPSEHPEPKIVLGNRCSVGRRSTISARNHIELEQDVLIAPAVLIMDHNHQYSNPGLPIQSQGITEGGRIRIEKNCWIGYGAVICCSTGELILGQNSVVGANSVVTHSFPACSVIAGNPARLVKAFDSASQRWVRAEAERRGTDRPTIITTAESRRIHTERPRNP